MSYSSCSPNTTAKLVVNIVNKKFNFRRLLNPLFSGKEEEAEGDKPAA